MKGKPIQEFENDYFVTETGKIIDLTTNKEKLYYFRGNKKKPRVDLYKNGTLMVSMYVEDIILIHFFGKFAKEYYKLTYKDNDTTNLSLSNLEIISNDKYITTQQIKKPKKIFELTVNGPVVTNQDEINEIIKLNHHNSLERERQRKRIRKKNYVKKLPVKNTPEYYERKMKQLKQNFIKSKVKELKNISIRDGVKCFVSYNELEGKLKECNYSCEITHTPLTFERKKDNTITIKRMGGRFENITLDNIIVTAKRSFL